MKAVEDLAIQYDGTVRQSSGGFVQFTYGDDSFDPIKLSTKKTLATLCGYFSIAFVSFGAEGIWNLKKLSILSIQNLPVKNSALCPIITNKI
jgi:hypothetical protein